MQSIWQIQDDQGKMQHETKKIVQVFVNFYQKSLGTEKNKRGSAHTSFFREGYVLSVEQQCFLLQPVTDMEIKYALISINCNKSPGPDGYGSGFYKASWDVISNDVCVAVSEFFSTGKLLKQINAMVALILKVASPLYASQYRPISCCNILYKFISKLLYNRMAKVLNLVSDTQDAFVK